MASTLPSVCHRRDLATKARVTRDFAVTSDSGSDLVWRCHAREALQIAAQADQASVPAWRRSTPRPRSPDRSRTRTSGSRQAASRAAACSTTVATTLGARCRRRTSATPGSWSRTSGWSAGRSSSPHVRRICDDQVERSVDAFEHVGSNEPDAIGDAVAFRVPSSDLERVRRDVRGHDRACSSSWASAMARLPHPVHASATSRRRRGSAPKTSSAASTMSSVSGRGMSTAGDTSSGRPQNSRRPVMYADGSRAARRATTAPIALFEPDGSGSCPEVR